MKDNVDKEHIFTPNLVEYVLTIQNLVKRGYILDESELIGTYGVCYSAMMYKPKKAEKEVK